MLTGYSRLADRITMLRWNPDEQDLSVDHTFGSPDDDLPGFFTNRTFWPHGKTGEATPHGTLFWPAAPPSGGPEN